MKDKKAYKCCTAHLTGKISEENEDHDYIRILSRGGLTVPSPNLTEYVCLSFAVLDICENTISKSELPARQAAQNALARVIGSVPGFSCNKHVDYVKRYCNRVITNVFFNNARKIKTAEVRRDGVKAFKKSKREKKQRGESQGGRKWGPRGPPVQGRSENSKEGLP